MTKDQCRNTRKKSTGLLGGALLVGKPGRFRNARGLKRERRALHASTVHMVEGWGGAVMMSVKGLLPRLAVHVRLQAHLRLLK